MERDPMNTKEWQQAVDAAAKLLSMEEARRYGLVNVARCESIIEEGKKYGHRGRT